MTRQKIVKLIQKSIKELQKKRIFPKFKVSEIKVGYPEEKIHGDYATNLALVITKDVKKNPIETANILSSKIKELGGIFFEKVEVAKPGFINFFISENYLQKQIGGISKQKDKFGNLKIGEKVHPVKSAKGGAKQFNRVNIEFISANPTGPLHIGNGRGAFFGDCLANILKIAGYRVIREYYVNDAKNSSQIQELGRTALGEGKSYLNFYLKSKISKLKPHFKKMKSETEAGYFLAQNVLGDTRKFIQKKLKIKFDFWISENQLYRQNKIKEVYNFLKNKSLVYKKDDAFWLKLSKFNQKNEVLIRANGRSTYFLSDIAYHKYKIDRGFQKIINIWGSDHQGHVPRTNAAMKILEYKGKFDILITQIVRLKRGKISKRTGEIITLEWLIDKVGLDAVRFFYLMKSLNTQMEFDVKLAKEKSQKSPVYYVQYAHARICSILRKAPFSTKTIMSKGNLKLLNHPSELALIKQLIKLPEIVEDISRDYQIQRLPQYTINLATSFHQFYRDCKVLSGDKELTKARLSLIQATRTVLKNTLDLMGVSAPEKM